MILAQDGLDRQICCPWSAILQVAAADFINCYRIPSDPVRTVRM